MSGCVEAGIWFPAVRTNTGTDVFTERLVEGLTNHGIRAEITWLPLRAEYAPWTVAVPEPPDGANIVHVKSWLHERFISRHLPLVVTIHHAVHHPDARAYKGLLRAAYHRWWIAPNERRLLFRANRAVAVSKFVSESTRRSLLDVPMQVIYNGVDTAVFRPGIRRREPRGPFILLFIGSWMTRKGVDLLAPVMRELGEGFVLHYTGGSAAERDKPRMPHNMIDIGRLRGDAAVAAAMQQVDALLFPSRSEGFGLVAAEAMACGLPVVATRNASLVEVIVDDETGVLCPPDDVAALAAAVRALAADEPRYERLRKSAREWVVEHFSDEQMLQNYLELYQEILTP